MSFTSLESWRYLFDSGPSPVQSLVVGNQTVDNVFQVLQDPRGSAAEGGTGAKWQNVVEFGPGLRLTIEANMEGVRDENSFFYRFSGGFFSIESEWGGPDGFSIRCAFRRVGRGPVKRKDGSQPRTSTRPSA